MNAISIDLQASSASRSAGYLVGALIGLAPLLMILTSWASPGAKSGFILLLEGFAAPILAAELFVILLAVFNGTARNLGIGPLPTRLLVAAVGLIAVAFGTSILAAVQPIESIIRTMILVVHILFGFSAFKLSRANLLTPEILANAMIAGFMCCCAVIALFVLQVRNPVEYDWVHDLPGFVNIRNLAYYAAFITVLSLGKMAVQEKRGPFVWYFICSTVGVALILWSGTRGAAAAVVAAYAAGAVLFPQLRKLSAVGGTLAAFILAGVFASLTAPQGDWVGMARFTKTASFSSGRTELWLSSVEAIGRRPFFGYGEGQTIHVVEYAQTWRIFSPHNILLQTLLAWGIVGTALLLILAHGFVARLIQLARDMTSGHVPFIAAMLAAVAYSLVDSTLYYVLTTAFFAGSAGMLLGIPRGGDAVNRV